MRKGIASKKKKKLRSPSKKTSIASGGGKRETWRAENGQRRGGSICYSGEGRAIKDERGSPRRGSLGRVSGFGGRGEGILHAVWRSPQKEGNSKKKLHLRGRSVLPKGKRGKELMRGSREGRNLACFGREGVRRPSYQKQLPKQ